MNIKKTIRSFIFFICISLLTCTFAFAVTACGGTTVGYEGTKSEYYLSLASDNWQVFNTKESIPENLHFQLEGENEYKLTIQLDEGEQFTINKLNSEEKVGYEQIFTTVDHLISGERGSIKVAHSGTFILLYNETENILSYSYSAFGPTPVSEVQLDQTELSLELNATAKLEATVLPDNAENKMVSWNSSNETAVTVSQDGLVTAVGYGTSVITVTTAQNSCTASCTITVIKHIDGLRFDRDSLNLTVGGSEKSLHLSFIPSDVTNKEYTLKITEGGENISAVKGENGEVIISGLKAGEAVVKAVSAENEQIVASCSVTVVESEAVFADMQQNLQIMIGDSAELNVALENSTINAVEWSVANENIATVSGEGSTATVTGVEFGSTVVTATITDNEGNTHVASCNVLIADDYFLIYGYNLVEEGDWKYENYINDRNAADAAGLLFKESSTRGIYTLTRHLTPDQGFQIIFPKVAGFTEHDNSTGKDVWNKNIPSDLVASTIYFSKSLSDVNYISNESSYFRVNSAGIYTVTLDLTRYTVQSAFSTQKYCCVYINMDSLDVAQIDLNLCDGDPTLKSGGSVCFSFSVKPLGANYSEDQVEIMLDSEFAEFENYVDYTLNFSDKTISVNAKGTIPKEFSVTLILTVRGVSTTIELYMLPTSVEKVPVSGIHFEQDKYEHNVNNGEGNWTTTVKALPDNSDVTNGQVRYYDVTDYDAFPGSSTHAVVNEMTGEVTASSLGTFKIKAVSLDNPELFEIVDVLFYSDSFYIVGVGYGGWDALSPSITSLTNTGKEQYKFINDSDSNSIFTFNYDTETLGYGTSKKMKIVFLGMDLQWTGQITAANIAEDFCNIYYGWYAGEGGTSGDVAKEGSNNIQFLKAGNYTLTIDLSRPSPILIIDRDDRHVAKEFVLKYSGATELHKDDAVSAELITVPFNQYQNSDVIVAFEGNNEYLSYTFDSNTNLLTFTVDQVEHSEDRTVTVSVTVNGDTQSLTFQIIAEHHLKLTWDTDQHWYYCTDENCNYTEDNENHDNKSTYYANEKGHYYGCSKCGVELNFEAHQYSLNNGVFDFGTGMEHCSVCNYELFKIENKTLVEYHGYAATVKVPSNVTIIGDHAFEGHSEIVTLTYEGRWTSIGAYAFAGCSSLIQISIDNRVATIGEFAFKDCPAKISWGTNPQIKQIGLNAFNGYLGTEFTFPKSVTTLYGGAFANSKLISIVIPDAVNIPINISGYTEIFKGCKDLVSVVLGTKISTIYDGTFSGCESLEYVLVRGEIFWKFGGDAFYGCKSLKAIYIQRDASNFAGSQPKENITVDYGNEAILGKLYLYTATAPDGSMTFTKLTDYFAGLWHYDDAVNQSLDNIVVWSNDASINTSQIAIVPENDKRRVITSLI